MPRKDNIQIRRGTSAEWAAENPVLDAGEPGLDVTNNIFKIGDGVKTWSQLSPANNPVDITSGTQPPSGGNDGDIYLQYIN